MNNILSTSPLNGDGMGYNSNWSQLPKPESPLALGVNKASTILFLLVVLSCLGLGGVV